MNDNTRCARCRNKRKYHLIVITENHGSALICPTIMFTAPTTFSEGKQLQAADAARRK